MNELNLAGEPEDSDDLETVEHWLKVYQELFAFSKRALQEAGADPDYGRLRTRSLRFEARLTHWTQRREELVLEHLEGDRVAT